MGRRVGVASWFLLVAAAVVAHTSVLASDNLLPRRVALHLAALVGVSLALREERWRAPFGSLLVALVGWLVATWLASPVRALGLPGMLDGAAAAMLCLSVAAVRVPRRRAVTLLVALGVGGAALGLVGQYVELPLEEATRPASWFASRSTAGAFLAACVPLAWWPAKRARLVVPLTVVITAMLVATRSRAAWAAALAALCIVLAFSRGRRALLVGAASVGVLLALALTPGPRLHWRSGTPYGDSFLSLARMQVGDRWEVWRETGRLILQRPWGWGAGAFEAVFAPHAPEPLRATVRVESPHNELLRVGFEGGLPALALAGGLLAWVGRRASRRTWLLRASVLALGGCALASKTLQDPPTLAFFAVVVGLQLRSGRTSRRRALRPLVWAVLVVGVVSVLVVDGAQVRASRALAQAAVARRAGNLRAAWDLAEPALHASRDLGAWLWTAEVLYDAGDATRCARLASEGLELAPQHPMLLERRAQCAGKK